MNTAATSDGEELYNSGLLINYFIIFMFVFNVLFIVWQAFKQWWRQRQLKKQRQMKIEIQQAKKKLQLLFAKKLQRELNNKAKVVNAKTQDILTRFKSQLEVIQEEQSSSDQESSYYSYYDEEEEEEVKKDLRTQLNII